MKTFAKSPLVRLFLILASSLLGLSCIDVPLHGSPQAQAGELRAGAAVVDVTPNQLPVLVNGGMLSRSAGEVKTSVNARALVLDDGEQRIGLVVVDSCMVPLVLLDDAKHRAASMTELEPDKIMVSATHTHTAPSSFGALGTAADPTYVPFLREKIAEALVEAEKQLQPARVGWGAGNAADFTALRRWVRRPDRVETDPFGNPTVRANMHAARDPENVTGPSGPEDPELSIIAFQSTSGVPIAALANFSMHYFGDQPISADYFGLFCDGLQRHVRDQHPEAEMVALLSHGCSGDIWRRDYMTRNDDSGVTIESYTQGLLEIATDIFDGIQYTDHADLAMVEARLPMKYRVPDKQRLQWAQQMVEAMESDTPKDRTEVYAREQVLLDQMQSTEIVVQAIRIGEIGIATTPNETYALTGLKIKTQSPLRHTMVIELANGADGYIPPPEQHHLGGYNTWAARSAGLEVTAEPRIVSTALQLLEKVSGKNRQPYRELPGPQATKILQRDPLVYWRMAEMGDSIAVDASSPQRHAFFEPGVCFFLEGPADRGYTPAGQINRCVHFAGGRMLAQVPALGSNYQVTLEFWNGMPEGARDVAGWLFSRDYPHAISPSGQHLGVDGKTGELIFMQGEDEPVRGKSRIQRWTWNRVHLQRGGERVRVFLNGQAEPEIDVEVQAVPAIAHVFVGGRSDNDSNWEGRIDEVVIEQ